MQGIPFYLGRDFLAEEAVTGRDHVAVMTNAVWKNYFHSDPNIIGRQIRLNGEPYNVVGVLAPGMADRFESQLMIPLAFRPDQITHDRRWLAVMGRMKPGVTLQQANAEVDALTRQILKLNPSSMGTLGSRVESLHHDFTTRDTIKGLWLLMGAVGFLLLIACVNVANLLLARGTVRQKEIAVRAALGARRSQLFTQFLTESLTLASIGGVLGVGLAWGLLKAIMAILPPFSIPTEADVRLNLPVLFFTLAATLLAGVVCGCAPAWQPSKGNLNEALKEGNRLDRAPSRHGLRRTLVVLEFALSLILVAGAGLALHSFWKLARKDLGFRQDHVLTFSLSVPPTRFSGPEQTIAFYRQLLDKIQALPGVSDAAVSTGMPVRGPNVGTVFTIAGQTVNDPRARTGAGFTMVTPGYFRTFGIEITKGRSFAESDASGSLPVAIVNETFTNRYLPNLDPLSHRIVAEQRIPGSRGPGRSVEWQIVGVYRDVQNTTLRSEEFPEINVPFWQSPWPDVAIEVRTHGDPANMAGSVSAAVQALDPDLGLNRVMTMDQVVDDSLGGDRFATVFLAVFAGMALLLSAIGIYGVMSFTVAQRSYEIGLRMALGAAPGQVLRLVLAEGIKLASVGLLIGLCGTYFVGRVMQSMLYEVKATDPTTFASVVVLLLVCAVCACYLPARRATRVDPMIALRNQ
jgi:putative ABC transport system permease protein